MQEPINATTPIASERLGSPVPPVGILSPTLAPKIDTHSPDVRELFDASPLVDLSFSDSATSTTNQTVTEPTKIVPLILEDLAAAGISRTQIGTEVVRGTLAEGFRWFSHYALIAVGLEAAVEKSPLALTCVGVWVVCSVIASLGDRVWRTRVNEFDRAFERSLSARLLRTLGRSTIADLDDQARQTRLDLHVDRVPLISNLVEMSVALPHHLTRIALSGAALMYADWRITVALLVAVAPGIWLKSKHTAEDVTLEELQSSRHKIADTVHEEAYVPNGSVRMILGRCTDRVVKSINSIQAALDREKDLHERRQAWKEALTDLIFYGVIGGSMMALYLQYDAGVIGIGVLGFLWLQLIELGTDLDDQGEKLQEYLDLGAKTKSFYGFVRPTINKQGHSFPDDYRLHFSEKTFTRGEEDSQFTLSLPEFDLSPGDFLVIHGASGAGKTTAQRHIAFGSQPEVDLFTVGGIPAHEIDREEWLAQIGYCGATAALLTGLSVKELLTLDPDGEQHVNERLNHPLISELLEDLHKGAGLETRIGMGLVGGREFSSGELQRLMLTVAMIPRKKILFLDEVTSNQNDAFITLVSDEIAKQRAEGTTVIFVTHSKRFDEAASHIMQVSKGVGTIESPAVAEPPVALKIQNDAESAAAEPMSYPNQQVG